MCVTRSVGATRAADGIIVQSAFARGVGDEFQNAVKDPNATQDMRRPVACRRAAAIPGPGAGLGPVGGGLPWPPYTNRVLDSLAPLG